MSFLLFPCNFNEKLLYFYLIKFFNAKLAILLLAYSLVVLSQPFVVVFLKFRLSTKLGVLSQLCASCSFFAPLLYLS